MAYHSIVCAVLILAAAIAGANGEVCRALALSGGGNRGAYEAGVVYGLVSNLPAGEAQWDVVTGISAGSLNTAAIGLFAKGDEVNMANFLVQTASNITQADVFQEWPGGLLDGLFKQHGLFDTSPLRNFIQNVLQPGLQNRKLLVGAVDMNTGKLALWNETDEDFATGVYASAAIPGIFEYVSARGTNFCDGGVHFGINVFGAVERCLEVVSDPANIIVDIVSCETYNLSAVVTANDTTLTALFRDIAIGVHDAQISAIQDAMEAYPTVNFRYQISPSWTTAPGSSMLDFNHTVLMEMVNYGYNDALNAIQAKPQPFSSVV